MTICFFNQMSQKSGVWFGSIAGRSGSEMRSVWTRIIAIDKAGKGHTFATYMNRLFDISESSRVPHE
jgi:hypothetical protein